MIKMAYRYRSPQTPERFYYCLLGYLSLPPGLAGGSPRGRVSSIVVRGRIAKRTAYVTPLLSSLQIAKNQRFPRSAAYRTVLTSKNFLNSQETHILNGDSTTMG